MSSKFITEVKQYADTEDYYIEIPDHILNTLKWQEGDEICWSVKDGKIILTKVKDSSSTQEEHQQTNNDWYTVKGTAIEEYLEKDFDTFYDDYIQATNEETYGDQGNELQKERTVSPPSNFPHFP